PHPIAIWVVLPVAVGSCVADGPWPEAAGGARAAHVAPAQEQAARDLIGRIGARFPQYSAADDAASQPFFGAPWGASFEAGADGSLSARSEDEAPPSIAEWVPAERGRLAVRLP